MRNRTSTQLRFIRILLGALAIGQLSAGAGPETEVRVFASVNTLNKQDRAFVEEYVRQKIRDAMKSGVRSSDYDTVRSSSTARHSGAASFEISAESARQQEKAKKLANWYKEALVALREEKAARAEKIV